MAVPLGVRGKLEMVDDETKRQEAKFVSGHERNLPTQNPLRIRKGGGSRPDLDVSSFHVSLSLGIDRENANANSILPCHRCPEMPFRCKTFATFRPAVPSFCFSIQPKPLYHSLPNRPGVNKHNTANAKWRCPATNESIQLGQYSLRINGPPTSRNRDYHSTSKPRNSTRSGGGVPAWFSFGRDPNFLEQQRVP